MWARVGPGNQAKSIEDVLHGGRAKQSVCSLTRWSNVGQDAFISNPAGRRPGPSRRMDEESDPAFSLAEVSVFQIQGDWTSSPVDLLIDRIELV